MKKRPAILGPEMVRAVLEGREASIIKPMKPQPRGEFAGYKTDLGYPSSRGWFWAGFWLSQSRDGSPGYFKCPHGQVGDRLWVKETWQLASTMGVCHAIDDYVIYRATDPDWETIEGWKWRSPIFMPRWASRITLEITDIRVERLQDIGLFDLFAQLGAAKKDIWPHRELSPEEYGNELMPDFIELWNSIYIKKGLGWNVNPRMWITKVKLLQKARRSEGGE